MSIGAARGRVGREIGNEIDRGRQAEAVLSPDKSKLAVNRDRNLYITAASDCRLAKALPITTDGSVKNRIKYGVASWVYGEELEQTTAFWWSPDGKKLAYYRFDESKIPDYYLQVGQTVRLPDCKGSVTFKGVRHWTRLQISRTPDVWVTLLGVVLALVGLLGSLFIRPRRVWVRAQRRDGTTLVEVAALDRSGGGDLTPVLSSVVDSLQDAGRGAPAKDDDVRRTEEGTRA